MMNHYCKSVNSDDGQLLFKISAIFEGDALALTIFQNETAWNVHVSKQELLSKSMELEFCDYYANLKEYIECSPKDVEFDFKPGGDFTINVVLENKMKMSYFHIQLKKVKFVDSIFNLIDRLENKKIEYFNELRVAKRDHASVKNAYDTMEKKMNGFIDRRKTEERNTYNNFIAILNEKKRQIQHLSDLLVAFRQGRPTINPPVQVKRKSNDKNPLKNVRNVKTTRKTTSESESNDSDNDHYNTDNSESSDGSKSGKQTDYNVPRVSNNLSPVPSTSKRRDDNPYKSLADSVTQLPKRIRSENTLKLNSILPKKELEETQEDKGTPRDVTNTKIGEKVPTVNFSTQELLDNL